MKKLNVAIVYDKAVTWGGAERLLAALGQAFPQSDIYTLVADRNLEWLGNFKNVYTSWAQKWEIFRKKPQLLALVSGKLFESFKFDKYDIVISVTSYDAKAILTPPSTLHLCYCLTPNRFLWVNPGYGKYQGFGIVNKAIHLIKHFVLVPMRAIDIVYASRPDVYFTLSKLVKRRIRKFYNRYSKVIYPGVDTSKFVMGKNSDRKYFLVVSRLAGYKDIDLVIKTFNKLNDKLIIVGDGVDKTRLTKLIESKSIKLIGSVSERKLIKLYQEAKALIMPQVEDFGLVALEAMACGTPVIINKQSGVSELVEDFQGIKISKVNKNNLTQAIKSAKQRKWNYKKINRSMEKFDWSIFIRQMRKEVNQEWQKFKQD